MGPGGGIPPEFRDYLKQYTIFRYLDSFTDSEGNYSKAILIPNKDGEWPNKWESPISAYEHQLWVTDDTLEIARWPNDQGDDLYDKILEQTGDDYAWGKFNKPVEIHRVDSNVIHYISGHNTPMTISRERPLRL